MPSSDRFAGLDWEATAEGAAFIKGATVWLDCSIYRCFAAGDYDVALLRVEGLTVQPGIRPLVVHASAFRRLAG